MSALLATMHGVPLRGADLDFGAAPVAGLIVLCLLAMLALR